MNEIEWNEVGKKLPPKDDCEFYGNTYSVPVLIANAHTGQVYERIAVYKYWEAGWCHAGLNDGPSPRDYELPFITHWALLPEPPSLF